MLLTGEHDDRRLRRHAPGERVGEAGRKHVRDRRRTHHCAAGPRHRIELQLLLSPRECRHASILRHRRLF